MTNTYRFPAEWEPQSAVLIAWPHAGTDWADRLEQVEETYIALVEAITRFQPAIVCVSDDDVQAYARARLASARIDMERVHFIDVPYDDTWLRSWMSATGRVVLFMAFWNRLETEGRLAAPGSTLRWRVAGERCSAGGSSHRTRQASVPTAPAGSCIVTQCRLPFCQISGRHGTRTISRPGKACDSTSAAAWSTRRPASSCP